MHNPDGGALSTLGEREMPGVGIRHQMEAREPMIRDLGGFQAESHESPSELARLGPGRAGCRREHARWAACHCHARPWASRPLVTIPRVIEYTRTSRRTTEGGPIGGEKLRVGVIT